MNNIKIGETISNLRKMKGLTQQELGDLIGVGVRAVSKWERGLTIPDISTLTEIAKVLEVNPTYLIDSFDKKTTVKASLKKEETNNLSSVICKALGLAMAIGVIVLNILNKLEVKDAITMLGIGLCAISFSLLQKK